MTDIPGAATALLYANYALRFEVIEGLRAMQIVHTPNSLDLKVNFYFDGPYTDSDYSDLVCMDSESFCEFEDHLKLEIIQYSLHPDRLF